jgi:hypothetical protein
MQKPFSFFSAAAVAAVVALAGCNNDTTNNNGFGQNCGGPVNSLQVLKPIDGSTRINPGINSVFVATNPALPVGNQYNFLVVQSSGAQQYSSTFARFSGSIPKPYSSPAPGSTVY